MLTLAMAMFCAAACSRQAPQALQAAQPQAPAQLNQIAAAPSAPPGEALGCTETHDGYLRVRLRGARNADIDWRDRDLQCDGGPRPDQIGMRLTFAGPPRRDGHRLRFVFGIGATRDAGQSRDVPANVTIIFEGDSKIYSTRGDDKCTVDELSKMPAGAVALADQPRAVQTLVAAVTPRRFRVTGRGFCIAPATAIEGGEGLLLSRFDFAGIMTEDDPATTAP